MSSSRFATMNSRRMDFCGAQFMISFVSSVALGFLIGVSANILVLLLPFYFDDKGMNDFSPRRLV
jgi:hypothetical protein